MARCPRIYLIPYSRARALERHTLHRDIANVRKPAWFLLLLFVFACVDRTRSEASHDSAGIDTPPVARVPEAPPALTAIQRLRAADSSVTWEVQSVLIGDVDCDGVPDSAFVGRSPSRVDVGVVRARVPTPDILSFGVHGAGVQNAVGSNKAQLAFESLDYDPSEAVGEIDGFQRSKECRGLNLGDEDSDTMHLFWNRKSHHLDWWRL